jgi:hypothetical protein
VVADSCHSGSVARYALAPAQPDSAPLKARFLPPYVFARGNPSLSSVQSTARSILPAPTKLRYPAVPLLGLPGHEFSYDTAFSGRPKGAFTRVAIDALQDAKIDTPAGACTTLSGRSFPHRHCRKPLNCSGAATPNWVACSDV